MPEWKAFIYTQTVNSKHTVYVFPASRDPMACACDWFAELWVFFLRRGPHVASAKMQIEMLMDQLSSRQVQLEMLDKRCILEAKRHRTSGLRTQFRYKMLEHRRLQAQLVQLQRYREGALAQLDAVSHHEINQTFVRAIQGAGFKPMDVKETESAIEDLQETIINVNKISDVLGQPLSEDIDDDDLEQEFLDFAPPVSSAAVVSTMQLPPVPAQKTPQALELRTTALFSG